MVPRERELAQRPRELVRAGREPRRLDGRLAELDRVGDATLHLVRVALDECDRDQQPPLVRGPGDRDPAVRVRGGLVVVLEVVLRPAEVVQRLQPGRQLGVRQPVDEGRRLRAVLARGVDPSRGDLAERQRRRGRGDEGAVAGRAGRHERTLAHRDRLLEVELVEAVHRQLELQRRRGRRRAVGQLVPGARQPRMRILVPAEPVLDRRAARGQIDPARQRVGGQQGERLQERLPAALELAERAQRPREVDPDVHLPLAVLGRQQPQRHLEPVRRDGRSTRRGRAARLQEQRDGLLVPLARAVLDVMRALGRRGAAGGQRGRGPGVRRELPATRRRLEDRAAHERVAEDEAPRHRGRAHEIERQEPVERREPLGRGQLRDHGCETGLERLAGDGGGVQQRALLPRQGCELLGERRRDGGRHPVPRSVAVRHPVAPRVPAVARELLEVERVASAVTVDGRDRARLEIAQQLPRLRLAELAERHAPDRGHRERGRQPGGRLARPEGEREEDRRPRAAPQQRPDQLDRCGVAPVQVVQHEHQGTVGGQQREQRADRPMAAVALVGHGLPARAAGGTQRGEDLAELEDDVQRLQVEPVRRDVRIERVRPDAEGKIALELRRHAGEHQAPTLLRAAAELGEQARLADPGLALDRHARRRPAGQRAQHRVELSELGVASDDRPGKGVGAHQLRA